MRRSMIESVSQPLRTVGVTRYVTPLREGGSLPAIVEADDLGVYVLKFRGAGQGPRVLIAELLCGELGRTLGLPVPEIVLAHLDPVLGRSEPDPEIQELIQASGGLNLGMDYLPGSFGFDPAAWPPLDADLASRIVWFDALITNVDRTARNTNMLIWHRNPWLIDHGAALYAQYSGPSFPERAGNPFPGIAEHVLLPRASRLREADAALGPVLTVDAIEELTSLLPDDWLAPQEFGSTQAHRDAFTQFLLRRLEPPRSWVAEAENVRAALV